MKYRILLIRHGETDWNKERKLQGITDNPLNESGKKHARLVADKILASKEKPVAIYSSPLKRTRQTAEILSDKLTLPIIYSDDIKEVNFGTLEGLTWDDVKKVTGKNLDFAHEDFRFDYAAYDGESAQEVTSRLKNFEKYLNLKTEFFGQTVLVVSHGTIIKFFLKEKTGKHFEGGFIWPAIYFPIEML